MTVVGDEPAFIPRQAQARHECAGNATAAKKEYPSHVSQPSI
jgi:hypothetical protein